MKSHKGHAGIWIGHMAWWRLLTVGCFSLMGIGDNLSWHLYSEYFSTAGSNVSNSFSWSEQLVSRMSHVAVETRKMYAHIYGCDMCPSLGWSTTIGYFNNWDYVWYSVPGVSQVQLLTCPNTQMELIVVCLHKMVWHHLSKRYEILHLPCFEFVHRIHWSSVPWYILVRVAVSRWVSWRGWWTLMIVEWWLV